jgi:hypothetical protein
MIAFIVAVMAAAGHTYAAYTESSGQPAVRHKKQKSTLLTGAVITRKVSVRAHVRKGRPVSAHTRKITVKPAY